VPQRDVSNCSSMGLLRAMTKDQALDARKVTALQKAEDPAEYFSRFLGLEKGPHRTVCTNARVQAHEESTLSGQWQAQNHLIVLQGGCLHITSGQDSKRVSLVEPSPLSPCVLFGMASVSDANQPPVSADNVCDVAECVQRTINHKYPTAGLNRPIHKMVAYACGYNAGLWIPRLQGHSRTQVGHCDGSISTTIANMTLIFIMAAAFPQGVNNLVQQVA